MTIQLHILAILVVAMGLGIGELHAESPEDSDWVAEAEPRLRAIYERREFRAKPFEADWLPDSSGYIVHERDADSNENILVRYDVRSGKRTVLNAEDHKSHKQDRFVSPDGTSKLEYHGRDLFLHDLQSGKRTPLIKHPKDRDIYFRDPKWSSDGKYVLLIESDSTDVRMRNVLVPDDPSYPTVRQDRFARVGETIAGLRIGVIAVEDKQTQWLPINTPKEGFYLGQVDWAGDSEVVVEQLSRFRDQREFFLISLDGEVQSIYQETNDAWAVGSHGINSSLNWIKDGNEFVVVSEKDGWRHAFLYSRAGEELAVLTPGEYDIIDKAVLDEAGGWYYFYASPENGTQKYLYRVPLDGSGTLERVSPENQPGTHTYQFSPDAKWAFHTYSRLDTPPIVELVELPEHRVVRSIEENTELLEKMQELKASPTEFLEITIGNDVTMDALMIKPRDFDENKKYPVFVYVYGEPYSQTVLDRWGAGQTDFHRVIADLGYIVVSIDNRGTPSPKGAAWRRSIFGSLGPLSTEDQAAGLKELGRMRSYVDLSRVAIWGWSGGGSNTLNAMFRKPDLYNVGIAVVPKPQPHLYNAWFQEIYMRTREVNAEGYERSAPINFAEGLEGKLLMITGSGETNTHMQIIEGLVDKLIELGKPFDYMVYPNRNHGLREGRGSELHVRMLITRYLVESLPRDTR